MEQYQFFLKLDVISVCFCQAAFYGATVLCGFADHEYQNIFLFKCLILSLLSITLSLFIDSIALRGAALALQMLGRWITQFTRYILQIGNQKILKYYMYGEILLFVGGVINVLRAPERFSASGRYDRLLNSHQIMHILVSISLFVAFTGIAADEETRNNVLRSL
jgi:predicted membrane channel-forming protein YqfA (hemolysin III family)